MKHLNQQENTWLAELSEPFDWFGIPSLLHTMTFKYHIIVTDEDRNMIVNALAFYNQFFKYTGYAYRSEIVEEWQDVADDTDLNAVDALATKIATSK